MTRKNNKSSVIRHPSSADKIRILVTNDDGINAEGLKILEKIALAISDDVWVVAPEAEQSGVAHSLTLHLPVRVRKISPRRFAVGGTPTDCVLLAIKEIIPSLRGAKATKQSSSNKMDRHGSSNLAKTSVNLILSGINHGSNVGDDVTYSGTIAAAMEGSILNVPSIALSMVNGDASRFNWKTAQKHAPGLIKKLLKTGWEDNVLINMNFPNCPPDKLKGVQVCPQGKRIMNINLSERTDPKGRPYFWLGGERDNTPEKPDVDIDYLQNGYITITPICMDLTDYKSLEKIRSIFN